MGSTGGVKLNWPLVGIALAVIGVPMGIAAIQDLGTDRNEEEILAKLGQIDEIASADEDGDDGEAGLERAEDIAGQWHEPAMDQAFFDEVFLGGPEETKPALRGPLAGIRWDSEPAAPPDLARWPRAHVELAALGNRSGRVNTIAVTFPDDGTAAGILASRWGDPTLVVGRDDLARRIWFDADARLRVVLEERDGKARATFSLYVPAAELIGRSGRFAFESHPILGATPQLLALKYSNAFNLDPGGLTGEIECPGAELSLQGTSSCTVSFASGNAVAVTVSLDHSLDPQAGPQLFAALRDRLGEPREQSSDDFENRWTFDRGYTVTQVAGQHSLTIKRVAR